MCQMIDVVTFRNYAGTWQIDVRHLAEFKKVVARLADWCVSYEVRHSTSGPFHARIVLDRTGAGCHFDDLSDVEMREFIEQILSRGVS